jgi:two-component sensor histidine kinase
MHEKPPLALAFQRTRALPVAVRYVATVAIVLLVFALRHAFVVEVPPISPYSHLLIAVLICSALFNSGSGILATVLSALLGAWFYLPSTGSLELASAQAWTALLLFVLTGAITAGVVEALHRAVAQLQAMHDKLLLSERARGLLLREFRHRTRNDLNSLVGLLMLRARTAASDAAREGLREAADHALALARVHARLTLDDGLNHDAERPMVDTRDFVTGLCADIEASLFGGGLRPIRLIADAEAHRISAERAVPLGLVLNETVTNSLKYAFPEDRPGAVHVRFARKGEEFVLTVTDDGIGLPPEGELVGAPPGKAAQDSGLGTRLLRALAVQLRGHFTRRPGEAGLGTVAEMYFPVAEPGS